MGLATIVAVVLATRSGSPATTAVTYQTALVARTTVTDTIQVSGTVQPATSFAVDATVTSPVTAVDVVPGATVIAGQVLARLDSTVQRSELTVAETQLVAAEDQAANPTTSTTSTPTTSTTATCRPAGAAPSGRPTGAPSGRARPSGPGPSGSALPGSSPRPSTRPSPRPSATASASATPSPTATPTPSPTATPTPTPTGSSRTAGQPNPAMTLAAYSVPCPATSGSPPNASEQAAATAQAALAVQQAQQRLTAAQAALSATVLTAPAAGVVTAVDLVAGALPSTPAIEMRSIGWQIQGSVAEQDVSTVEPGQSGQASFTALGVQATATVLTRPLAASATPASLAAAAQTVVTFPVLFAVTSPPPGLLSGMSATITVTTATRANVLAVPTSALTDSGNGPAVRVLVAGSPRVVPVVTGLSTATLTQITSGLSTGQRIITGVGGSASLLSGLTGLTGTGG